MKRAVTGMVIARFKVEGAFMVNLEELIGSVVIHGSFGRGIILDCTDNRIKVEFSNLNKVSTFLYPECFIKHLDFECQKTQEDIHSYLEVWKSESGYTEKEELWKKYQKVQSDIVSRRKAAEEKKRLAAEKTMENRTNSNFRTFPQKK